MARPPNPLRFPESLLANTGLGPVALLTGGGLTLLQCLLGTHREDVLLETGWAQTETAVLGNNNKTFSMGSALSLREHSKACIAHNELRDKSPFSQRCQLTRLPITSALRVGPYNKSHFDKDSATTQWKNGDLFNKRSWDNWTPTCQPLPTAEGSSTQPSSCVKVT